MSGSARANEPFGRGGTAARWIANWRGGEAAWVDDCNQICQGLFWRAEKGEKRESRDCVRKVRKCDFKMGLIGRE